MPVTVATAFADSTTIPVVSTAAEVMTIEVMANPSSAAAAGAFVQVFDSLAATLGTDAPMIVTPIRPFNAQGAQTMQKATFHQGVRCTTGINIFVTSSAVANTTAAAGTNAPQQVRVFWLPA